MRHPRSLLLAAVDRELSNATPVWGKEGCGGLLGCQCQQGSSPLAFEVCATDNHLLPMAEIGQELVASSHKGRGSQFVGRRIVPNQLKQMRLRCRIGRRLGEQRAMSNREGRGSR